MGQSASQNPKINKNHNRQKMFRIGLSIGRNDLSLEGHLQAGYRSVTNKQYKPIDAQLRNDMNAQLRNESDDNNSLPRNESVQNERDRDE